MEDWVTIKTIKAKNPSMSYREIARIIGVSPNTVISALARDEPPAYKRKSPPNPQLDPFHEVIAEMVNVKGFRGSRILEEIKSKGYTGGKSALYTLLAELKVEYHRTYQSYETAPGEQSQFDWSPYTVLIAGNLAGIVVYSYINSFSRFRIYDGALAENQGAVFEAFENSLIESGGVPRRVQTDNAGVFMLNASRKNRRWNPRYLHLCGHYGFEPSRSLPRHPWSKGKVEKPFDYLETHFIAGASFSDFPEFLVKLKAFQDQVNARVHGTTKVAPNDLIATDRAAFSVLPATRYVGVREETRKASCDNLIAFGGSRYSVPWPFAGKYVWIRISKGYYLEVYSQANALVAVHKLSLVKGAVIIDQAHYRTPVSTLASMDRMKILFRDQFPAHDMFLEKLLAQKRLNARHHLHEILALARLYHRTDFEQALAISLEYNIFTVSFLSGYLEKNFKQSFDLPPRTTIAPSLLSGERVTRDLGEYQLFAEVPEHPTSGSTIDQATDPTHAA